jgi:hypothetical protein
MSKKKQTIIAPDELIVEAENLDREARRLWTEMDMHITAAEIISVPFGKIMTRMRNQGLHKFVRKGSSKKGYPTFPEWINSVTGGKMSKSSIYMAMGIGELNEGPNAIPAEEIAQMPKENAYRLATSLTPEQRTPEMIEHAKKTPREEFPKRIQEKINEGLPADKQVTMRVDFFRQWHPDVIKRFEQTIERFILLPIVRDNDRALTLQEKAVLAICFAAESDCHELLKRAEAEAKSDAEIILPEAQEAAGAELAEEEIPGDDEEREIVRETQYVPLDEAGDAESEPFPH